MCAPNRPICVLSATFYTPAGSMDASPATCRALFGLVAESASIQQLFGPTAGSIEVLQANLSRVTEPSLRSTLFQSASIDLHWLHECAANENPFERRSKTKSFSTRCSSCALVRFVCIVSSCIVTNTYIQMVVVAAATAARAAATSE